MGIAIANRKNRCDFGALFQGDLGVEKGAQTGHLGYKVETFQGATLNYSPLTGPTPPAPTPSGHVPPGLILTSLGPEIIGGVTTTPDPNTSAKVSRYKWEPYRDTNWWCTYYFLPRGGHTLAKVCHRNGRCIAIFFRSIGVRGRFDTPELRRASNSQITLLNQQFFFLLRVF